MRMRRKKNLDTRLIACAKILPIKERSDFYSLDGKERFSLTSANELFGNSNPTYLEIGCGKGEFAVSFAQANPEYNILAIEKLGNVIVEACEQALLNAETPNLRFANCSAENLLYFLPEKCAEGIFLNFSCPYPKKSYANRRLTNEAFLRIYKLLLKANGCIRLKTDNADFFDYSAASFRENGFSVTDETRDLPSEGQIITAYERKFRSEGKKICYLKATLSE